MEPIKHNKEILTRMALLLEAKAGKACVDFLIGYGEFVELYDDYVDKDKKLISIHEVKAKLVDVMSGDYWRKNAPALYLVEKLIHLQFHDVVKWEHSDELWKREHAKVLSHCAYNMLFAILIMELGLEVAQGFSDEFRTTCHLMHLGDKI